MTRLLRIRALSGLAAVLALPAPGWTATASDDDLFTPSPFVQATAAFEQGDLAKAETLVLPLTANKDADAETHALLGQIRLKQGRPAEAVAQYRRAVALNPASPGLRSRLGTALLDEAAGGAAEQRAALQDRARAELERAAAADGGCLDAQMGLLHFHLERPEAGPAGAAEKYAAAAAALDPLSATYEIGELAEKHGRPDLAEPYFGAAAKLFPAIPWLPFKHGDVLLKLGRVAEARVELEALLKAFPGFAPAQEVLGTLSAQ